MSLYLNECHVRSTASGNHHVATREIRLDGLQANRWLEYLENISPFGENGQVLTDFWKSLSHACWLAKWNRDCADVQIELAAIPTLIEIILSDKPGAHPERNLHIEEDILATLSNLRK
jgi:hypothetical protein